MRQIKLEIREEDENVFSELIRLTGEKFPDAVAKAVHRFVEQKTYEMEGMTEVRLTVGYTYIDMEPEELPPSVTFIGKQIASYFDHPGNGTRWYTYISRKGKLVFQIEQLVVDGWYCCYFIMDKLPDNQIELEAEGYSFRIPEKILEEVRKNLDKISYRYLDI